ncbi:MAG: fasciclin domain-containing protein [Bacteroidaceae bacterium]|nr:fasciclin domain-containing protein [Bacteroidaceae bacterium]
MKQLLYFKKHMLALLVIASALVACTEEIDKSNRYTFTEYTVLSYLQENEQFSEYVELLNQVPISEVSSSTVAQLLSARGAYTCFAPNNEAIQLYLDSLQRKGLITEASWAGFKNENDLDSIRKVIVYNSIINSGDAKGVTAFDTGNFPVEDNGEFETANMNERKLRVIRGSVNQDSIYINGEAPIHMQHRDIEAINGYIHEMVGVIAPSNETLADKLLEWIKEGDMKYVVTAKLILAAGLADTLSKQEDLHWRELYLTGKVGVKDPDDRFGTEGSTKIELPEHRKYGFTIFAETDDVWEREIGKPVAEITVEDIKQYLIAKGAYPDATTDDNYTNENNIINQFITYHILPEKLSHERLVVHWNELGYDATQKNPQLTIPVMEYFCTMGRRRLLKLYESKESNGVYINRFPKLLNGRGEFSTDNGFENNYHESGQFKEIKGHSMYADENEGIRVENYVGGDTASVAVVNGYFHPINKVLVCTDNVRNQLMGERIRIDFTAMFPEFMNNDIRDLRDYTYDRNYLFPTDHKYFDNIDIMEGSRFYYLSGWHHNWLNYQGTELNIVGQYEFTMKLPPVPKAGHYEIRYGIQVVSARGMAQVYFGDNPNALPAMGIPLDIRMGGTIWYNGTEGGASDSNPNSPVGWEPDTGDQGANDDIDKHMRNNGFMKGPANFSYLGSNGVSNSSRSQSREIRRIIVSQDMDPDKQYYIKFKSVQESKTKQFYMDFLEWCAKEVYDNPVEGEDIW